MRHACVRCSREPRQAGNTQRSLWQRLEEQQDWGAKPRLSGCGSDELLYHSNDDGASDVRGYPRGIAAGKMQNSYVRSVSFSLHSNESSANGLSDLHEEDRDVII